MEREKRRCATVGGDPDGFEKSKPGKKVGKKVNSSGFMWVKRKLVK